MPYRKSFFFLFSFGVHSLRALWHRPKVDLEVSVSVSTPQCFLFLFLFFPFCFLGPYSRHMEVPRLEVQLELQLPACTAVTATRDLSLICDRHHSSWQRWILNSLSKSRDQTHSLVDTSRICFHCVTTATSTPQCLKDSYEEYIQHY